MQDFQFLGSNTKEYYGDCNDIDYDAKGNILVVTGENRTRQDVTKILLTEKGHPIWANYGSVLNTYIKTRNRGLTTREDVMNTVVEALSYLKHIQTSTILAENIDTIESLTVETVADTGYEITIVLLLENGDKLQIILAG